jgi:pilus assembly protein CpaF
VVQVARLAGGARKITQIAEVTGLHGDTISMHDVFAFRQTGVSPEGNVQGDFESTGIQPQCLPRLRSCGLQVPRTLFEQGRCSSDRVDGLRTK